jgi:hypothetical protein
VNMMFWNTQSNGTVIRCSWINSLFNFFFLFKWIIQTLNELFLNLEIYILYNQ